MKNNVELKFGELRKYISKIDRLSICIKETLQYENYRFIQDVPESYNDYYIYGIGMIDSEFQVDGNFPEECNVEASIGQKYTIEKCIDIMLSEIPRDISFNR